MTAPRRATVTARSRHMARHRRATIARFLGLAAALIWLWDFHELTHPTRWTLAHSTGLVVSIGTASFSLLAALIYLLCDMFTGGRS